jgi:hypothetical protein
MKSNIVTITIEANWESELIQRLEQIITAIKDGTLEDNELMDGSYQVGSSNIELEPKNYKNTNQVEKYDSEQAMFENMFGAV